MVGFHKFFTIPIFNTLAIIPRGFPWLCSAKISMKVIKYLPKADHFFGIGILIIFGG
jgi:hypothetical protein